MFGQKKKNILDDLNEELVDSAAEETQETLEELKHIEETDKAAAKKVEDERLQQQAETVRQQAENAERLRHQEGLEKQEYLERERQQAREAAERRQKELEAKQSHITSPQKEKLDNYLQQLQVKQSEIAKTVNLFELIPALHEASESSIAKFEDDEVSKLATEIQKMDKRVELKDKAKEASRARQEKEVSRLDAFYHAQELERIAEVQRYIKKQREEEQEAVRDAEANTLNQTLLEIENTETEKLDTYSKNQTERIRFEKKHYQEMCKDSLNKILGK
ncbi:hypothetical protein [Lactococcus allomyrinae]|uniref:Uncharacterized protein n=1 Tax=Lactococcus allomyrinae TaxID=2419773 RepID=A0A387BBS5_9LACT|nr:hypothetical protein [Lactococcus allomyrinae]AYF99783.1 hypothetical protein D7I46_00980 [Lactococcus allomyrinae]